MNKQCRLLTMVKLLAQLAAFRHSSAAYSKDGKQFIGFFKKFTLIIVICGLLNGCIGLQGRYPPAYPSRIGTIVGTVGGAVIGAAAGGGAGAAFGAYAGAVLGTCLGCIIEKNYTLVERLQYNGVQVIQLGDEIKLILPTDLFFNHHSAQLNYHYQPILNMVADFLFKFEKISVEIAGFTDNQGPWQRNLALSREQAQHLMMYLWNYNVDARLMYSEGYGEKYPIANNYTERGRHLNRRIEISLRKNGIK